MFIETDNELWQLISDVASDEGLTVYDIELVSETELRIFVENRTVSRESESNTQGGVTCDDCSRLCRRLMVLFSVEAEKFGLKSEPKIEVSSPGINRRLRLKEHYTAAIGQRVKINAKDESIIGVLSSVLSDGVEVSNSSELRSVSFDEVKKARVDFQF